MDYSRYFTRAVWQRGVSYWRQKRVKTVARIPRSEHESYMATVQGTMTYSVKLEFSGERLIAAGCTCLAAAQGNLCKHIAAAICEVCAMFGKNSGKPTETRASVPNTVTVRPFPREADPPYDTDFRTEAPFFRLGSICENLYVTAETEQQARALAESGRVRLENAEIFPGREGWESTLLRVLGSCEGKRLSLLLSHTSLAEVACECDRECYAKNQLRFGRQGCCEHVLALLYRLQERTRTERLGSATDENGTRFLRSVRGTLLSLRAPAERKPEVRFEPRLRNAKSQIALTFRAGREKLYVIRNLKLFLEAERDRGEWMLGVNNRLDFAASCFDAQSQPLADWAWRVIRSGSGFPETAASFGGFQSPDTIVLNAPLMDEFFALMGGHTIPAQGMDSASVTLEDGDVQVPASVEPIQNQGDFLGVRVSGQFPEGMHRGMDRLYCLTEKSLLRLSPERSLALRPLAELADEDGTFELTIGRDSLPMFYREILPAMQESLTTEVREPELIERFVPPQAVFTFRLDKLEDDIFCEAVVTYQQESRFLLQDPDGAFFDEEAEVRALGVLREYFPVEEPARNGTPLLHCPPDEHAVYRLLSEGVDALSRIGTVLATDRFSSLHIRRKWKWKVGVSLESDVMNLEILSDDLTREELSEILAAYAAKKKYHRLRGGDLVDLSGDQVQELDMLFQAAHVPIREFISGHLHMPAYRALYLDKLMEEHDQIAGNRDRAFKSLVRSFKTVQEADEDPPERLQGVLRPYQEQGFRWLSTLEQHHFGGILADDMGLGKTLQLLSLILRDKEKGILKPSLIVCPSSLMYNWQAEAARFTPDLRTAVIAGSQAERRPILERAMAYDLLITSYDLLRRDFAEASEHPFHIVALDEAQNIKNHATATAKAVKSLKADYRFALTGTPVENRLSELWSIFDFLMPGFLYPYETFSRELETPIVKQQDKEASERLRRMISPFVLRRLKRDVLRELPEKTEEVYPVDLTGRQRELYDAQVVHLQNLLNSGNESFDKKRMAILAELTRLRQICCDPGLMLEDYDGPSAKRDALMELLQTAVDGGHKVLVFSQFTTMLDLLAKDLTAQGIDFMVLTGATPKEERLQMTQRFNTNDTPVFLISLKAGGTGLNLTGADIVIHYDPWWNLAAQNQATDRAYRIGQDKPVSVYRLIARNTIEDRIVQLQESKRDLAESVLSGEQTSLASLSREELLALVE